jgi:Pentapeptide repeats (8 copies)
VERSRLLVVALTLFSLLAALLLLFLPGVLLRIDLGPGGARSLSPAERAAASNDARVMLVQGIGGGLLLVGAYLTWRQLQVSKQGQITERYTRAVEQLGSSNRGVQVGGIYALERIAHDSNADRSTVREVLTAFIRERATWQQRSPQQSGHDDPHARSMSVTASQPLDHLPYLRFRMPEVQAAITVLGRLPAPRDTEASLELRDVDLRKGNLGNADLRSANLRGALLDRVWLQGAHLEGANLSRVSLRGANMGDAHLEGADLRDADLTGAHYLSRAHLRGAIGDGARWPRGFDPGSAGVQYAGPGSDEVRGR